MGLVVVAEDLNVFIVKSLDTGRRWLQSSNGRPGRTDVWELKPKCCDGKYGRLLLLGESHFG
jgi:hypothetical protein